MTDIVERERTMMADKDGKELFLGDVVRSDVDEQFREFGIHGDWAEYEITKAPGGYALTYLRSQKGAVLPFGYVSSYMTDYGRNELPDMKILMFSRGPVAHPALTWIDDRTTREDRMRAFEIESKQRMGDRR